MGVSNYYRGRSREYRALQLLRRDGWLCSRSAASHSPIDIFAGKGGQVIVVQVKSGRARMTSAEVDELRAWAKAYNARAEVWKFGKRGQLTKKTVYGS